MPSIDCAYTFKTNSLRLLLISGAAQAGQVWIASFRVLEISLGQTVTRRVAVTMVPVHRNTGSANVILDINYVRVIGFILD